MYRSPKKIIESKDRLFVLFYSVYLWSIYVFLFWLRSRAYIGISVMYPTIKIPVVIFDVSDARFRHLCAHKFHFVH